MEYTPAKLGSYLKSNWDSNWLVAHEKILLTSLSTYNTYQLMIMRVRELDPYLWEPNIDHHMSVVSEFRALGIIELDPYLCVWIDIIFALHF